MGSVISSMSSTLFMDLLSSKKFKALLALVALFCKPVYESLGLDPANLLYVTYGFCAFFIAQGFRDLGEELAAAFVEAVRIWRGLPSSESAPAPKPVVPPVNPASPPSSAAPLMPRFPASGSN